MDEKKNNNSLDINDIIKNAILKISNEIRISKKKEKKNDIIIKKDSKSK